MKPSKLTQLVLDEISGVDEGAHGLDGWMIQKGRAIQHPTTGRFIPAQSQGLLPGVPHNDSRHTQIVMH